MPRGNAAKTRNPLKLGGVPQTNEPISAASGPKFTILQGHVGKLLLFNKFFLIVDKCLSCEDVARQICEMVRRWRIFGDPLRPASGVQQVSDLHPKLALKATPCVEVWWTSNFRPLRLRRGKRQKEEEHRYNTG